MWVLNDVHITNKQREVPIGSLMKIFSILITMLLVGCSYRQTIVETVPVESDDPRYLEDKAFCDSAYLSIDKRLNCMKLRGWVV